MNESSVADDSSILDILLGPKTFANVLS